MIAARAEEAVVSTAFNAGLPEPGATGGPMALAQNANGEGESPGAKVNINMASAKELDALPGIGEVLAGRIIQSRDRRRGRAQHAGLDLAGSQRRFDLFADVEGKFFRDLFARAAELARSTPAAITDDRPTLLVDDRDVEQIRDRSSRSDHRACGQAPAAYGVSLPPLCRKRRIGLLWT